MTWAFCSGCRRGSSRSVLPADADQASEHPVSRNLFRPDRVEMFRGDAVDDGSVEHGMLIMSGTEIRVRMKDGQRHPIGSKGRKGMHRVGKENEHPPGQE